MENTLDEFYCEPDVARKENDALIAKALGCRAEEVENYHIGSPVNGTYFPEDPEITEAFDSVKELFESPYGGEPKDSESWVLKTPGEILYTYEGYEFETGHYFDFKGMHVVVAVGGDGPYIFIKDKNSENF